MNTEELKKEIEMNSYTENPNSLTRVIDVDTVLELIDELANNNESIDLVIESYTIDELKYAIKGKEHLLEEIKEHSIGDSCGALAEFTAESELKIMRKELSCR